MKTLQASIRSFSKPVLWTGYIHNLTGEQDTRIEYRNMSNEEQRLESFFVNVDGSTVEKIPPISHQLVPGQFLNVSVNTLLKAVGMRNFQGQWVALFENRSGVEPKITPAVTTHWISKTHHCEVATQGIKNLNISGGHRMRVFYMYCPVVIVDAATTTVIVVFNSSTDSQYLDSVQLEPVLRLCDGSSLNGKPLHVNPFGMAYLDVAEYFGVEGEQFLARTGGYGSVSISHIGHNFTTLFFHIKRATNEIISGQHTQAAVYALLGPKIWWGKLRRYSLWS